MIFRAGRWSYITPGASYVQFTIVAQIGEEVEVKFMEEERKKKRMRAWPAGGAVSGAENATAGADACSLHTLPPCSPSSSGLPTVSPQRAVHLSSLSGRPTLASRILRLVDYNFLRKFPLRKRGQTNNKMLANVIPPRYDSTQI